MQILFSIAVGLEFPKRTRRLTCAGGWRGGGGVSECWVYSNRTAAGAKQKQENVGIQYIYIYIMTP